MFVQVREGLRKGSFVMILQCTRLLRGVALVALGLLLPVAASANHMVEVRAGFEGDLMALGDAELPCSGSGPTYSCAIGGSVSGTGGGSTLSSLSLTLDEDPSVSAITAVTNDTSSTRTFVLMVTLPVGIAIGSPTSINGSIAGSITDTGDGLGGGPVGTASIGAASGSSIYKALIDGSPVKTLLADPFSQATATGATVGPASFGPEDKAVATTTDIGITLRSTLSPGDSASFTSVFTALVPEPGTAVLLGTALPAAVSVRRAPRGPRPIRSPRSGLRST